MLLFYFTNSQIFGKLVQITDAASVFQTILILVLLIFNKFYSLLPLSHTILSLLHSHSHTHWHTHTNTYAPSLKLFTSNSFKQILKFLTVVCTMSSTNVSCLGNDELTSTKLLLLSFELLLVNRCQWNSKYTY